MSHKSLGAQVISRVDLVDLACPRCLVPPLCACRKRLHQERVSL